MLLRTAATGLIHEYGITRVYSLVAANLKHHSSSASIVANVLEAGPQLSRCCASSVKWLQFAAIKADTTRWTNAGVMLAHGLRLSHNINPALDCCLLLSGMWHLRDLQSDLQDDIFCLAQPLLTSNSCSALLGCLARLPWHVKVIQSYELPINHHSLSHCCFNDDPPPSTLSQH